MIMRTIVSFFLVPFVDDVAEITIFAMRIFQINADAAPILELNNENRS